MKIWVLVWASRDEWHAPGVSVFPIEETARDEFVKVAKAQLEYSAESTLLAVVEEAPTSMKYDILRIWVQDVETEFEMFIDEVQLPEPGWYAPPDSETEGIVAMSGSSCGIN